MLGTGKKVYREVSDSLTLLRKLDLKRKDGKIGLLQKDKNLKAKYKKFYRKENRAILGH